MTAGNDRVEAKRGPLLYGLVAVLVGVAAAIFLGMSLGDGGSPVAVNPSGSATAVPSVEPSPTESSVPSVSPSPSPLPSLVSASAPAATPTATPLATSTAVPTKAPPPPPPPTKAPPPRPTPTPTPNTDPAIVTFTVPATVDCTVENPAPIHLSWTIARATGVTLAIDGTGIYDSYPGLENSADLLFGCSELTHSYTLRTTGGTGPAAEKTEIVTAAAATIDAFGLGPANCPSAEGSVGIGLTFTVSAATGVALERDRSLYSTFEGKRSSEGLTVAYDCSKPSQTFKLSTLGGFGNPASKELVVERSLP